MNKRDSRIDRFLIAVEVEGRSSPTGIRHEFYEFLQTKTRPGKNRPPPPLILGAAVESDRTKHERLRSQVEWALDNDCVDEAIRYPKELPADRWNDRWNSDKER